MRQIFSFFVIFVYILAWSFLGSVFFGQGGLKVFLITSLALIWITFFLGDKLILFLLGARELSLKDVELESYINRLSCRYEIPPMRLYKLSIGEPGLCLIKSASNDYSLVITDDLLRPEKHREFVENTISSMDYRRDTLVDLAVALSYQILLPGYLLGHLSSHLKSVYFYLLYPIILIKSYLSHESRMQLAGPSPIARSLKSKNNTSLLVKDIISDYGIIFSRRSNLWNDFLKQ